MTPRERQIEEAEKRLSFRTGRMSSLGSDGAMVVLSPSDPVGAKYRSSRKRNISVRLESH